MEACTVDGWDIKLLNQPPNSPDINNMCLGLFKTALLRGEDVLRGADARHPCKDLDFSPSNFSGGHTGYGRQPLHASPPIDEQGGARGYNHPEWVPLTPDAWAAAQEALAAAEG